jgi:hypothetical protein
VQLKGPFCPVHAPQAPKNEIFDENNEYNQLFIWHPQGDSNANLIDFLIHQRQPKTIKNNNIQMVI